jgi:regulator of protease activity HflC (stomatin/prohibitin superfamily)
MNAFRKDSEGPGSDLRTFTIPDWKSWSIWKVVAGLLLLILLWSSVTRVPTGHVGVLTLFGRVTGQSLGEGIHLINPLKVNNKMSVQTQNLKEVASVPSNEGLILALDTSLIFRLNPVKAPEVFQSIQPPYVVTFVEPNLRSAVRAVTTKHTANALYTGAREIVAFQIRAELAKMLEPRGIIVEDILLRDIQLPALLKAAVESKQQAEQEALRMSFILQKEKQEAERKRIEAQGIADFQRIVSQSLSQQLLEWKGIETTEKLASSNNAKVVVIGAGKSGLPLILGGTNSAGHPCSAGILPAPFLARAADWPLASPRRGTLQRAPTARFDNSLAPTPCRTPRSLLRRLLACCILRRIEPTRAGLFESVACGGLTLPSRWLP